MVDNMTTNKKLEDYYIIGAPYRFNGKIYHLVDIYDAGCYSCEGIFGKCSGFKMKFEPSTPWRCPYNGQDISYEKVELDSTNTRW